MGDSRNYRRRHAIPFIITHEVLRSLPFPKWHRFRVTWLPSYLTLYNDEYKSRTCDGTKQGSRRTEGPDTRDGFRGTETSVRRERGR